MTAAREARNLPRRYLVGAGMAVVLGVALVVVPGGVGTRTAEAAGLAPFGSCDELADWYAAAAEDLVGPYGLQGTGGWLAGDAGAGQDGAEESAVAATGSGPTGTNVQETGVDEPDVIKTDGSLVVVARGDLLSVLDVSGGTPTLLGRLPLPAGNAGELLLVGDRALVLGAQWDAPVEGGDTATSTYPVGTSTAVLTVVDLSDPADPRVERREEVEGAYLSAREADGAVRIVINSTANLPFVYPDGQRSEGEAAAENRRLVRESAAQDWLPHRIARDDVGAVAARVPLLDCEQVSHPNEPSGLGVVSVLTMDLRGAAPVMSEPVAVAADGNLVYASTDRLYVATTRGGWMSPRPFDDLLDWLPGNEPDPVVTELHGFDIGARTTTSYLASGEVEGWLLGRWAMSAQDGFLRVATTRYAPSGGNGGDVAVSPEVLQNTDSAVTVLAENADQLTVVGSVGGLGAGEQIRAVRWFGDLATVVTFRQTDPLYTVDLSDPTAPVVLGELKVTGYSAYLHPLGDGLLLGVGQEATEQGTVTGAQISTFDLRELSRPALLDSIVEPDSWSDVEWDSRAFAYLPELRLAVTPVSGSNGSQLWSVRIGADGDLTTAAQWSPGPTAWLIRAVPVGGDRIAVLSEADRGQVVTLMSAETLVPTGSAPLR